MFFIIHHLFFMQRRSIVASLSAFLAGLLLAVGMNTALATGPSDNPPDGNVSPHFYAIDIDTDADFGQPELDDNNDVQIDGDGSVYAQSNTLSYNIWGYNSAAAAGEMSILGRVITSDVRSLTVTGYVGYVDASGNPYGLYTDGNIGGENLFIEADGIVHTNQITADTGSLDVVASGGMNLAGTNLTVDGDLTADTVGSFRYECAGTTSGTSVTASCDGANDVMVACSGYSINDYEGAIPTSATDCTAYTTSDSVSLQAYAYCFDPSSTTNTTSTTCSTVDIADTTAPSAPTGLSATPSGTTVSLNWNDNDSSEVVSYYYVYRSTTSGFSVGNSYEIGTATASAYSDTGLSQGTTYYYKVTAVDPSLNESSASSQASATIVDTTAPSAPTGVSCTTTSSTVSLDWSDNAASDGVSSYNIYRSTTSGFTASSSNKIKSGQTSSSYTNSSLSSSTTYYYKITAVDGSSNESSTSSQETCTTSSSGDGTNSSFVAGTKVLTFAGLKNIEDLKTGDKVFSFDLVKKQIVIGTVTTPRMHTNDHYYLINNRLKVTEFHPIAVYIDGKITWKKVQDLVAGDLFVTSDQKTVAITSITRVEVADGITVYNPSIDGQHNYFVLLDDLTAILVHNKTYTTGGGLDLDTEDIGDTEPAEFLAP